MAGRETMKDHDEGSTMKDPREAILETDPVWTSGAVATCAECAEQSSLDPERRICLTCAYAALVEAPRPCAVCRRSTPKAWPCSARSVRPSRDETHLVPCCSTCLGEILRLDLHAGHSAVVDVAANAVVCDPSTPWCTRGRPFPVIRCRISGQARSLNGGDLLFKVRPLEDPRRRSAISDRCSSYASSIFRACRLPGRRTWDHSSWSCLPRWWCVFAVPCRGIVGGRSTRLSWRL